MSTTRICDVKISGAPDLRKCAASSIDGHVSFKVRNCRHCMASDVSKCVMYCRQFVVSEVSGCVIVVRLWCTAEVSDCVIVVNAFVPSLLVTVSSDDPPLRSEKIATREIA